MLVPAELPLNGCTSVVPSKTFSPSPGTRRSVGKRSDRVLATTFPARSGISTFNPVMLRIFASWLFALLLLLSAAPATNALNGQSFNTLDGIGGWKTFEVITQGDSNGNGYVVPGEIDGMGAFLADDHTLRVLANHETGRACDAENEATVTEVDLDLSNFQTALRNMITSNSLNGEQSFVRRFRRAYDTIVDETGQEVQSLSRKLRLFCSSQAYGPNTFGDGEGFQDQIYTVGEEYKGPPYGRLFAIDSSSGKMYQVTDRTGDASASQGGNGGMMWDSFENTALIRTFEKDHVAFLIAIDGGSEKLKLYVGQKNKGTNGQADSTDFLARNGLAYGSWFYLKGALPILEGETQSGFFLANTTDALTGKKFEDIDTNPLNPTQVVLGDEKNGIFIFDFDLSFVGGKFQSGANGSTYTIKMIVKDSESPINQADNVAWTEADLIYVATDGENGAIWEMDPNGNYQVEIAVSKNTTNDYNPSGVIDISRFVGYEPASILLASTMNCGSSMSVLIKPDAMLLPEPAPPAATPKEEPGPTCSADNKCDPILGFPGWGEGELIFSTAWAIGGCAEICFFPHISWMMQYFGWACGTCPPS